MKSITSVKDEFGLLIRKVRAKLKYPVNERLIQVCGIQRSGNHALINWIISQEKLKTCFINGVLPNKNPWQENWGISYKNFEYWPRSKDNVGAIVSKQLLICSYENQHLEQVFANQTDLFSQVGYCKAAYSVLILRDPYNTFASWLKADWKVTQEVQDLWKAYAKEFIGQTNFLPEKKVIVNFNEWSKSQTYRQELAKHLNLEFTDEGFDEVTHHGGGSSFDQQRLHGNAKHMKVLERFVEFIDHPAYIQIFQDEEIRTLSEAIFGKISGTEKIKSSPKVVL